MLVNVILAALGASCALAARTDPLDVSPNTRSLQGTTTSSSSSTQTITVGSSASCTAHASGSGWKKVFDVHTSAMAEAIAVTCEKRKYEGGSAYLAAIADAFSSDTIAIAEAVAETKTVCKGRGNVKGCAYSEATVEHFVKVWANVHAKAAASAETKCNHCSAKVNLKSKLKASVYTKIIEKITAYSFSNVCIGDDKDQKKGEFEKCTSSLIAEQFAYAFASAFLDTDCLGEANGDIETKADAFVTITTSKPCTSKPPRYY